MGHFEAEPVADGGGEGKLVDLRRVAAGEAKLADLRFEAVGDCIGFARASEGVRIELGRWVSELGRLFKG